MQIKCLNCKKEFIDIWSYNEDSTNYSLYQNVCPKCLSKNFFIYNNLEYTFENKIPKNINKSNKNIKLSNYGEYSVKIFQRNREAKISHGKYVVSNPVVNFSDTMIKLVLNYMTELSIGNFKMNAIKNPNLSDSINFSYNKYSSSIKDIFSRNKNKVPQEAIANNKTWVRLKRKKMTDRQDAIHINAMLDWVNEMNEIFIVSFPVGKTKLEFFVFLPYFKNIIMRDKYLKQMQQIWYHPQETKIEVFLDRVISSNQPKKHPLYYSKYRYIDYCKTKKRLKVNHIRVKQYSNKTYFLYLPIRFFLWETMGEFDNKIYCDTDEPCKIINDNIIETIENIPFKNNDYFLSNFIFSSDNYNPNPFKKIKLQSPSSQKLSSKSLKRHHKTSSTKLKPSSTKSRQSIPKNIENISNNKSRNTKVHKETTKIGRAHV